MKVFVHIGFHKTGTSTLQAVLEQNVTLLGDSTAVLLHNSECLMPLQKACLAFSRSPNHRAGERIVVAASAVMNRVARSRFEKVLISTEMLSGPIPSFHRAGPLGASAVEIAPYLRRAFECYDTCFCVYTRNQDRWLTSLHAHLVRSRGLRISRSDFLARANQAGFSIGNLADSTAAALGKCIVLAMEDDAGTRLGPGTGFFHLAGYSDTELKAWHTTPPQNVGLDARVVSRLDSRFWLATPALFRKYAARWLDKRA